MADEFGFGGMISSGVDTSWTILLTVFYVALFAGIIWIIWFLLQYKYKAYIRVYTKEGYFWVMDKARLVNEKGVTKWKLWNLRVDATVPPPEAMHVNKKGKLIAEGYYTTDTGVLWSVPNVDKDKILQMHKEHLENKDEKKDNLLLRDQQIFTTVEKELLAQQVVIANSRKTSSTWDKIKEIIYPFTLVIIFIFILIFWKDIAEPVQLLQESNAEISRQNAEIAQYNAHILGVLYPGANISVRQNIPPDAKGLV